MPRMSRAKRVGVLRHDAGRFVTVGLEDPNGPGSPDAIGVQENHNLPHGLLLGPAANNALGALWTDASDFFQSSGVGFDDLEGVLGESSLHFDVKCPILR